ncbi:MAG: hypothetical protein NXI31_04420 [bacterium]|nr:hypothetical protein [bacterium]
MTAPAATTTPGIRWWHALLLFAGALTAFLLLPQRGVHGVDGNTFAVWVEEGNTGNYARHAAYLWLCSQVYSVFESTGITGHQALLITSALGSATGVLLLLFAFARLLPRDVPPLLGAAAALATPSYSYFATTGEIAGVLAVGVGLTWWLFARWCDRSTFARVALLGIGCGIAGAIHALGHLLTPVFVLTAAFLERAPKHGRFLQLTTLFGCHVATAVLLSTLLARDAAGQATDAADVIAEYWETFAPLTAPAVLWREWFLPFLPWSVGALVALLNPVPRRLALATLAAVLLYLAPNVVFLGYWQIDERGAYFGPLLPLAILTVAHSATFRAFVATALAGLVITAVALAPGWRNPVSPGFGAGIAELNAEQKIVLIVANREEIAGARSAVRDLVLMDIAAIVSAHQQQPEPTPFPAWFDTYHAQMTAAGMRTIVSAATGALLTTTGHPGLAPFWNEHVPAKYELVPIERQGFRGTLLRPRK